MLGKVFQRMPTRRRKGRIEISTSPFYHPILPLVCDTNMGAVSTRVCRYRRTVFVILKTPANSCGAAWICIEKVFGVRPQGVWPSEGSVSEEVLAIAQELGVKWMATDEGVLGRSLGVQFRA